MFSAAEIRKLKHRRRSGSGPPQVLGDFGGKFERQRGSKPDGKQNGFLNYLSESFILIGIPMTCQELLKSLRSAQRRAEPR